MTELCWFHVCTPITIIIFNFLFDIITAMNDNNVFDPGIPVLLVTLPHSQTSPPPHLPCYGYAWLLQTTLWNNVSPKINYIS